MEKIKQILIDTFNKEYKNTALIKDNIDSLKSDIVKLMHEYINQGIISCYEIEPPKIISYNYKIYIDIMSMFKNFPKYIQEDMYCNIYDIGREHINKFIYNDDGYIMGIKPKNSINYISIDIDIE